MRFSLLRSRRATAKQTCIFWKKIVERDFHDLRFARHADAIPLAMRSRRAWAACAALVCVLLAAQILVASWAQASAGPAGISARRPVAAAHSASSNAFGGQPARAAETGDIMAEWQQVQLNAAVAKVAELASRVAASGLANLSAALGPGDVMVTFGSASLAPFVANWLSALVRAGSTSLLVGALDDGLLAACVAARVPVVRIPDAVGAGGGAGYIRKDWGAFKSLGLRKVRFLEQLLVAVGGRHGVWACDADMVWTSSPPPSLTAHPSLAGADVLISTDCLDLRADARGDCADFASFNTGIMYLRQKSRTRELLRLWRDAMEHVGPEPWMDDQSVLNELIRKEFRRLQPAAREAAAAVERPDPRWDELDGPRTYTGAGGAATFGLLPLSMVANGHTFFVQHACAFCHPPACSCAAPLPYAVHATFQYGDSPKFAYGKHSRLAQAGFWYRGPYAWADRSSAPAAATEPAAAAAAEAAAEVEHFVSYSQEELDEEAAAEARAAGLPPTLGSLQRGAAEPVPPSNGSAAEDSRPLIALQLRADARWRRRVLALLSLGLALNRTVVLARAGGMAWRRACCARWRRARTAGLD